MLKLPLKMLTGFIVSTQNTIGDWSNALFEIPIKLIVNEIKSHITAEGLPEFGKFSSFSAEAPIIEEWDNTLPTLIIHGIDDECDSGLVHGILKLFKDTSR